MGRSAVLQDQVWPVPSLRKPWFKNAIFCDDEGWSLTYSGSTWRVDRFDYRENGRLITFGGEGAVGQMDLFLPPNLAWEDAPSQSIDEATQNVILRRITGALQWAGFKVGFFEMMPNNHRPS
jgi:hypothetical protein